MNLLPEWAPNVHPMIVHFPIVLILVALLFDLMSLIFRNKTWLRTGAHVLYFLGAIAAVITYLSGRQAADTVEIAAQAYPVLSEHADLALYTVLFFGIYALLRLFFVWKKYDINIWAGRILFIIALGGNFFLFETAEHGAELVYKYGVGVKVAKSNESAVNKLELSSPGITVDGNGSWIWNIDENATKILEKDFTWLNGNIENLNPKIANDNEKGIVLSLDFQNKAAMVFAGNPIKSLQADMLLNLDSLSGNVFLIHHVIDKNNYDIAGIENHKIVLGRVSKGERKLLDQKEMNVKEWLTLRAVADGSHFRGYINEKLFVHGHAEELTPGKVGLFISGTGKLLLKNLKVQSLISN